MKRIAFAAIALALVIAVAGYAAADALDKVPGVLTIAPDVPAMSSPLPSATPLPTASAVPELPAAGLAAALAPALADRALGPSVAMTVVDATTGSELFAQGVDAPRRVASLQKLLSAFAVAQILPADSTLTTSVMEASDGRLVLNAGGDLYLNPGAGDPNAVVGRAGLADLAAKTAATLGDRKGPWVLSLNVGFAAGPEIPDTWDPVDVQYGYAGRVSNLGLSTDRADEGKPSPADPARRVAVVLVDQLRQQGLDVSLAPADLLTTEFPVSGTVASVDSAPVGDLLAVALQDSDNALTEELVRAAKASDAYSRGESAGQFVTRIVVAAGIPESDLTLVDASGLSAGQTVTVRALSQLLTMATDDTYAAWRIVVLSLPIAGLTGTLAERFDTADTKVWAGIPREKTGTLTGISSVGGWTVDADGRSLFFVVVADQVSPGFASGTLPARVALDRLVGVLTDCGCR